MLNRLKYGIRGRYKELTFPYRRYMDKHKCIFIHIPKTAGTSIITALIQKPAPGRLHLPWYIYEKANPYKFTHYFKFAFVRNPWDRIYSAYNYLIRGGNMKNDLEKLKQIQKYRDFDEFVIKGLGQGRYRNIPLFLPQAEFVIGFDQQPAVDFIGKVENIDEDFKLIARKLGIKSNLPRVNTNNSLTSSSPYQSEAAINVIYDLYRQDIECFGYSYIER